MLKSCAFSRASSDQSNESSEEGEACNRARAKLAPTGIASNGESRRATNISCRKKSRNRGCVQCRLQKPICLLPLAIKGGSCQCSSSMPYHIPFYICPGRHAWAISLLPTTSFSNQLSPAFSIRHPFVIYTALYILIWSPTILRSVYISRLCVANVHAT